MQKDNKSLYTILYSGETSRCLAVTTTKDKAIQLIKEYCEVVVEYGSTYTISDDGLFATLDDDVTIEVEETDYYS